MKADIGLYDKISEEHRGAWTEHIQYMRCHRDSHCAPEMA